MERKEFLRQLIIRGSAAALLPAVLIQSCEKDDGTDPQNNPGTGNDITIDLASPANAVLLEDGGSVNFGDKNIIVINRGNDEYIALSTVCTHQGCTVGYNSVSKTLPCPCHGSVFNIDRSVRNGPASSSLRAYPINLDGTSLVVDV